MVELNPNEYDDDIKKTIEELSQVVGKLNPVVFEDAEDIVLSDSLKALNECKNVKDFENKLNEYFKGEKSKKVVKLSVGVEGDNTTLYFFADNYEKPELRGKVFLVDRSDKKPKIYAVYNISMPKDNSKPISVKGFSKDYETLTKNFNKIEGYNKGPINNVINFLTFLANKKIPKLKKIERPEDKDIYAIIPANVKRLKEVIPLNNPKRNYQVDAKKLVKGMIKKENRGETAVEEIPKTKNIFKKLGVALRRGRKLETIEGTVKVALTEGENPTDDLDTWININTEDRTIPTSLEEIKKSPNWYKVVTNRTQFYKAKSKKSKDIEKLDRKAKKAATTKYEKQRIKDYNRVIEVNPKYPYIVVDTYDSGSETVNHNEGQKKRLVFKFNDNVFIDLLYADENIRKGVDKPYTEAFRTFDHFNDIKGDLGYLDSLVAYTRKQEKAGIPEEKRDNRGASSQKNRALLKTGWEFVCSAGKVVGLVALGYTLANYVAEESVENLLNNEAKEASFLLSNSSYETEYDDGGTIESDRAALQAWANDPDGSEWVVNVEDGTVNFRNAYFSHYYNPETKEYSLTPNAATVTSEMGFNDAVTNREVTNKVAPAAAVTTWSGWAGTYFENPRIEGAAEALGMRVANELENSLAGRTWLEKNSTLDTQASENSQEMAVLYPTADSDRSTYVNLLVNQGYSEESANNIATSYAEGFTNLLYRVDEKEDIDATEDPTLPEGYDEIYDAEDVYYTNNKTLQTTLNKIVGLSKFNINTINVVSTDSGSLVTIFVTPGNDTSVAYEISFDSDSTINTTRELCTALENAINDNDYSKTTFQSIDNVLSLVGEKAATINSYKECFVQGVEQKLGVSLQLGGNIYVYAKAATGEFEVAYINSNSTVTFGGFVEGNIGDTQLPAIGAFYITGGSLDTENPYTIDKSTVTTTTYNNQGEILPEEDYATPENDGREM